jgi:hypothetical protein
MSARCSCGLRHGLEALERLFHPSLVVGGVVLHAAHRLAECLRYAATLVDPLAPASGGVPEMLRPGVSALQAENTDRPAQLAC